MFRPRIIPVLLLKNRGLVKSVNFKNHRYIGDPINAVKIFNDLKADELVFLDILASREKRTISVDFVKEVGDEANMPFAVGGGIKTLGDIEKLIKAGAEKVIINSYAVENPHFIKEAAENFGSSTIVAAIDVKKNIFKKEKVYAYGGRKASKYDPVTLAQIYEANGVGEIIITSIEQEGTMQGYDLTLIKKVASKVLVPVVAHGGAGSFEDFKRAVKESYASAVAAGSMFVYHGPRRAVLINYPNRDDLMRIFQ